MRPRVLLVEDDPETLKALAAVLREEFAVWVARDGTHALEVAQELDWDADVLVVDLALGEGPRGDQFVAYYRTREKHRAAVIVISGAPRAHELARAIRPSAILFKPLDVNDLMRSVRLFSGLRGDSQAAE